MQEAAAAIVGRTCAYPAPRSDESASPEDHPYDLDECRKSALAAYWRALFDGALPETLPIPAFVEDAVRRRFPGSRSAEFWSRARAEYALRWFYGGLPVTYWDAPHGRVVLAVGNGESIHFLACAPPERRRAIATTTYPPGWEEVGE